MTALLSQTLDDLRHQVSSPVIVPSDPNYDGVRAIWNAMINRRPAVIVQCTDAADVPRVIRFAQVHGLDLSIRGAGHNIAGNSLCEGGFYSTFPP